MTKITKITDEQLTDCAENVAQTVRDHLTYNLNDMLHEWAIGALEQLGIDEDSFEDEEDYIDTVHDVIGSITVTTF